MSRLEHPRISRPVIDYDLALMIQPIALLGTVVGVMLAQIFPDWLVLVLLILTLFTSTYLTGKKGVVKYRQETKQIKEENEKQEDANKDVVLSTKDISNNNDNKHERDEGDYSSISHVYDGDESTPLIKAGLESELDKLIRLEKRKFPLIKIGIMFFVLVIVCLHSLIVGGKGVSIIASVYTIKKCSWEYWLISFCIFPILILITILISLHMMKLHKKRVSLGYVFDKEDVKWSKKVTSIVACVSGGSGILASLLGIGGGMILTPMMLELKVNTQVTSATSTYMLFFTSLSSLIQFSVLGQVKWDYGVTLLIIGFFTSVIGQTGINYIVRKYKRQSYIIFCIITIIAGSAVLLIIVGGINLSKSVSSGANIGFLDYCPK
eukprot:TRINITY_DN1099_c0_g2_i1.p1 TRINITY_DN1099_c0_g2~~TRINITY_DN1099_c0_g2_i1.p1  ORF type:complete len:379 (-),score=65.54 TRINITY_DN1099_c0_g2_i1:163-1299(-)